MRITAVVNQKGGCGKTTSAINLAAVYARRGLRTLLVDMDPQAHCAAGLGVPESCIERTIADALLCGDADGLDRASFVWEVARNLDLAPSSMRLAALEAPGGGLHEMPERDRRLERVLATLAPHYDRCLVDCPPTIGLLTFNALRAAREVLIPVETGYFSLKGAQKQWETIQRVIRHIGRPIACHILPTLHEETCELSCDILAALRKEFAGQILPIVIREHVALGEAASMGQAIIEYAPGSPAHADYEALADWLEAHQVERSVEIEIIARADGGRLPVFTRRETTDDGSDAPRGDDPLGSSGVSSRAAELAGRLRSAPGAGPENTNPGTASPAAAVHTESHVPTRAPAVVRETPSRATANPADPSRVEIASGVTPTADGAWFAQPAATGSDICIAGAFNGWNPAATMLRAEPGAALATVFVPLSAGHYRYRVVVDGRWTADPHNPAVETSAHGEEHSTFDVPGSAVPAHDDDHLSPTLSAPADGAYLPQAAP